MLTIKIWSFCFHFFAVGKHRFFHCGRYTASCALQQWRKTCSDRWETSGYWKQWNDRALSVTGLKCMWHRVFRSRLSSAHEVCVYLRTDLNACYPCCASHARVGCFKRACIERIAVSISIWWQHLSSFRESGRTTMCRTDVSRCSRFRVAKSSRLWASITRW